MSSIVATAFLLLAAFLLLPCLWAQGTGIPAPSFPTGSIVNSASGSSTSVAPNTLVNLSGTNLSFDSAAAPLPPNGGGTLPTQLAGVSVVVGFILAPVISVSPTQVTFLIPNTLVAGQTNVVLVRNNLQTPPSQITLLPAAPGLFMVDTLLLAQHSNGSLITPVSPAQPGESIVVYSTGLGPTNPRQLDGVIPKVPAPIVLLSQLQILLDGQPLDSSAIQYAGITPGTAGVYQINFTLPAGITDSPALQISIGGQMSQSGVQIPVAVPLPPFPAAPCSP
jgi:uncharacterized protein (TIGR03437 family)